MFSISLDMHVLTACGLAATSNRAPMIWDQTIFLMLNQKKCPRAILVMSLSKHGSETHMP